MFISPQARFTAKTYNIVENGQQCCGLMVIFQSKYVTIFLLIDQWKNHPWMTDTMLIFECKQSIFTDITALLWCTSNYWHILATELKTCLIGSGDYAYLLWWNDIIIIFIRTYSTRKEHKKWRKCACTKIVQGIGKRISWNTLSYSA